MAGRIWPFAGSPDFPARSPDYVGGHCFALFPHQKLVRSPLEMNTDYWNVVDVLHLWVDIYVVARAGKAWDLAIKGARVSLPVF